MKKKSQKRIIWVCMGVLIALLSWSIAWADFYVIAAGSKAKKTILVSPKSTQTESGTALLDAMTSITDASSTNRYLILIEPGVYDIGTNSLQMKEYVDIQGSGENATKITGTKNSSIAGVLMGADNAEVRFLTVENTGGGSYANTIYCNATSPKITNVTATASGGSYNRAISVNDSSSTMTNVTVSASGGSWTYGISIQNGSSPTLTNVSATASGGGTQNTAIAFGSSSPTVTCVTATASGGQDNYGVDINQSSPIITNLTASASGGTGDNFGIRNYNSTNLKIDDSVITGSDAAVSTTEGYATYIGCTKLDGGVTGDGTHICVCSYDETHTELGTDCSTPP